MSDGTYGYREKFPWPTHYYGMAVRELAKRGARVIGFDILFGLLNPAAKIELPDGTEAESDRFFAAEPRRRGRRCSPAEAQRSEEHTSELQSLTNLVCRLLLEKKKIKNRADTRHVLARADHV